MALSLRTADAATTAGLTENVTRRRFGVELLRTCAGIAAAGTILKADLVFAQAKGASPAPGLPLTPTLPNPARNGMVAVNGTSLFFAEFGAGQPVLFLHGGLANSNYWGHQVAALADRFRVIVMDTRGHGRSEPSFRPFGYASLATDVVSVLDTLQIQQTAIVGWSDGGIIGLDLALTRANRLTKLVAFGANFDLQGLKPGGVHTPIFSQYLQRAAAEYRQLAPQPSYWSKLLEGLKNMWGTQPTYTKGQLGRIRLPVLVLGAENDEIIRDEHTRAMATAIPGAKLIMERGVSHFAMLQNPGLFNRDVEGFL